MLISVICENEMNYGTKFHKYNFWWRTFILCLSSALAKSGVTKYKCGFVCLLKAIHSFTDQSHPSAMGMPMILQCMHIP